MPATTLPTAREILEQLRPLGREPYKKVLLNHGVKEPVYGVKIEDLKKFQKRIKVDYQLALDLYDTGIYDAMYLAGLIADDDRMTKRDIQGWLKRATSPPLVEYTVPWVAVGSRFGWDLALEWIDSKSEDHAAAGWSTLSGLVATRDDEQLDLKAIAALLKRVAQTIHRQTGRVRYVMNGFVIAVGCYVPALTAEALTVAKQIGTVEVDMGATACKVPDAAACINKVKQRGTLGKKRKSIRC